MPIALCPSKRRERQNETDTLREVAARIITRIGNTEQGVRFNGETVHMDPFAFSIPGRFERLVIDGRDWGKYKLMARDQVSMVVLRQSDAGITIPAHDHPGIAESILVRRGLCVVTLPHVRQTLARYDTLSIDVGVPHEVRMEPGCVLQLTWIK